MNGYKMCLECWKHDSALHTIAITAKIFLLITLLMGLELISCWEFTNIDFKLKNIFILEKNLVLPMTLFLFL